MMEEEGRREIGAAAISPLKVGPWCHGRRRKTDAEMKAREPILVYDMPNESTWESLHEKKEWAAGGII